MGQKLWVCLQIMIVVHLVKPHWAINSGNVLSGCELNMVLHIHSKIDSAQLMYLTVI